MKFPSVLHVALALGVSLVAPAYATETLYIPASIATQASTEPNNECYAEVGVGFVAANPSPSFCQVDFPLTVPVGHTIKQIAVVHSDINVFGNPHIQGYLSVDETIAPFDTYSKFIWDSSNSVPFPTIETTNMMGQFGKIYLDSFTVQTGMIYHVVVHLERGTVVHGLQITYE